MKRVLITSSSASKPGFVTASVRELGKRQRKTDILNAARSLVRASGDLEFTMRTLAERAGVSIATPYTLFGSKQAILLALLDADLAEYETRLAELEGPPLEAPFQAITVLTEHLGQDPRFYRKLLQAVVQEGGPQFRWLVAGPRYLLWKRLLGRVAEASFIDPQADPDALAIAINQSNAAVLLEWIQGALGLAELEARLHYALAVTLGGLATDAGRPPLTARRRDAETRLQTLWRDVLRERLAEGPLDDDTRAVLADQLRAIESEDDALQPFPRENLS